MIISSIIIYCYQRVSAMSHGKTPPKTCFLKHVLQNIFLKFRAGSNRRTNLKHVFETGRQAKRWRETWPIPLVPRRLLLV